MVETRSRLNTSSHFPSIACVSAYLPEIEECDGGVIKTITRIKMRELSDIPQLLYKLTTLTTAPQVSLIGSRQRGPS
jgi:hypothetical protein